MYFLPLVTSTVAVGLVWLWLYAPQGGLLNELLRTFGIPPQQWITDPFWAMPAIIVMSIWQGLGVNVIVFIAGLQAIPWSTTTPLPLTAPAAGRASGT